MRTTSLGYKAIGFVGIALVAAVAVGIGPRLKQREALAEVAKELAGPRRVRTAVVRAVTRRRT